MPISYYDSATAGGSFATAGTVASGDLVYKELTIPGVAVGDLIVVFAVAENSKGVIANNTISTQSGSTAAWTITRPSTAASDTGVVGGYARVTAAGSVTVRGTLEVPATTNAMGVGAWLIPADEAGTLTPTSVIGDTDGLRLLSSVPLGGTVLYLGADLVATSMGSTPTPTNNAALDRTYFDANYGVWTAHWTNQASGGRNYGPGGLSARDISGVLYLMTPMTNLNVSGTVSITSGAEGAVTKDATVSGTVEIVSSVEGSVQVGVPLPHYMEVTETTQYLRVAETTVELVVTDTTHVYTVKDTTK